MKNISELAYELYKLDWKKSHMVTTEVEQDSLKDYYEGLVDFDGSYSFDEYIEEFGYLGGQIYACYEEFMASEYLDEEYIKGLLNNDKLFMEYEKDLQEQLSIENEMYEQDTEYDWEAITSNHSVSNHMIELSALLKKAFENEGKRDIYSLEPWHITFRNIIGIKTFQLYHEGIEVLTGNTIGKEYKISEENKVDLKTLLPVIEKALPDYKTDIKIELIIPVNINEHWMKTVENAEYFDTVQYYRPEDISDGYGYDVVLFNLPSYKALENVIIEDLDPSCIYDGPTQKFKFIEAYTSVDLEKGHILISANCFEPVKENKPSLADKIKSAKSTRDSQTIENNAKEPDREEI